MLPNLAARLTLEPDDAVRIPVEGRIHAAALSTAKPCQKKNRD
jgi:hypothetical protein